VINLEKMMLLSALITWCMVRFPSLIAALACPEDCDHFTSLWEYSTEGLKSDSLVYLRRAGCRWWDLCSGDGY